MAFWAILVVVGALASAHVWRTMDRGWVPHDEGALGQSAERVLQGEVPHRDFDELYTGGLTYLHALALRIFGENLRAMRTMLFIAFVLWIPALYYLATRFARPSDAGAVVLLITAWSLPAYSAPVPSWYNLFFAVWGAAALARHVETGRTRWLVIAGALGGLSVLIKVAGLYFIAGALLFLLYREQGSVSRTSAGERPRPGAYSMLLAVMLAAFTAALVGFVRVRLRATEILDFVVPGALVAGLILAGERRRPTAPLGTRLRGLFRLVVPFLLGALLPVAIFAALFAAAGAFDALREGVFVAPRRRLFFAAYEGPGALTALAALPLALLLALEARAPRTARRWAAALLAVPLGVILVQAAHPPVYRAVWHSMRWIIPVTAVAGMWSLASRPMGVATADAGEASRRSRVARETAVLLLAVAATGALVQFPFSAPIYFLYALTPAILAAVALLAGNRGRLRPMARVAVAFYLVFGLLWIDTGFIYGLGVAHERSNHSERLDLPRGGLRVPLYDKQEIETLARFVEGLRPGRYVWAGPDAPEVNFLTGTRNPTRVLFDFLGDDVDRTGRTLEALRRHEVRVVVVNRDPQFSGPLPPDLAAALGVLYPRATEIGRFQVRWRE